MALKLMGKPDVEKRVAKLERLELKFMKTERNLYYTLGALFGMLVLMAAMFIPFLANFYALGLVSMQPDPLATGTHLFMAVFFVSMLFCFYKGLKLETEIPE